MRINQLICALVLIMCSPSLMAQSDKSEKENNLSVSLQLRPRAEYRHGALIPRSSGTDAASYINNRTRLSIDFNSSNLSMGFSVQQVGVWGDVPQVNLNNVNIQLKESWAQLKSNNGAFIKFGRQVLSYDDERILGGLDWNMSGRSHDAVKFGLEKGGNRLHAILAYNQNKENIIGNFYAPGGQPYKTLQALYYQFSDNKKFIPSLLFMNIGVQAGTALAPKLYNMQTLGTHLILNPTKGFNITGTAYYQMGKNPADLSISAYMLALKVGYDFTKQWGMAIGSDYLSGQSNGATDGKYRAFNPLYGTHHKFYGTMDYFFVSPFAAGFNPGLWDNYLSISYKPSSKYQISAAYHYFSITSDNKNAANIIMKRGLGSEVDLQLDWNIMKDVKLTGGYSFAIGTSTMDVVKGGDHKLWQDWGWLSIIVNPKIFSTKW